MFDKAEGVRGHTRKQEKKKIHLLLLFLPVTLLYKLGSYFTKALHSLHVRGTYSEVFLMATETERAPVIGGSEWLL